MFWQDFFFWNFESSFLSFFCENFFILIHFKFLKSFFFRFENFVFYISFEFWNLEKKKFTFCNCLIFWIWNFFFLIDCIKKQIVILMHRCWINTLKTWQKILEDFGTFWTVKLILVLFVIVFFKRVSHIHK